MAVNKVGFEISHFPFFIDEKSTSISVAGIISNERKIKISELGKIVFNSSFLFFKTDSI